MLTHTYSYDACLRGSLAKPWSVDDCFRERDFDFAKSFVPERIAGVNDITCLNGDEKRLLNQIRGNSAPPSAVPIDGRSSFPGSNTRTFWAS